MKAAEFNYSTVCIIGTLRHSCAPYDDFGEEAKEKEKKKDLDICPTRMSTVCFNYRIFNFYLNIWN